MKFVIFKYLNLFLTCFYAFISINQLNGKELTIGGHCPTIKVNINPHNNNNMKTMHNNNNYDDEYDDDDHIHKSTTPPTKRNNNNDNDESHLCERKCNSDSNCQAGYKCCQTSCNGTLCIGFAANQIIKPGACQVVIDNIFLCVKKENQCENDAQCTGHLKCCEGLCGNTCQEPNGFILPLPHKPGQCPQDTSKNNSTNVDDDRLCKHNCRNDFSCPNKQKCCSRGCHRICVEPGHNGGGKKSNHYDYRDADNYYRDYDNDYDNNNYRNNYSKSKKVKQSKPLANRRPPKPMHNPIFRSRLTPIARMSPLMRNPRLIGKK